ncbi:MHC class II antigen presentation inhibitor [Sea otter poxvirus]|uniref:MHC class II antigen presentation inhibitor n=1 Tax=Sea otter poxvirus TaxID=1416741 RepID=A0A2U9QHU1_9POXV|nr:MHC class II antigen presentation inhibitor [Sea otter poxvirus]AWU47170.1 MHC class II antigen presentation inhibitor [Sea otter poxvirus]
MNTAGNILTSLGQICWHGNVCSQRMCHDLNIKEIRYMIGDYFYTPLDIVPITPHELKSLANCYISAHGYLMHCSDFSRTELPITIIHKAYKTTNSIIVCCDNYNKLNISGRCGKFQVLDFKTIVRDLQIDVLEVYDNANYNILLSPSKDYLNDLVSKCSICLASESWIIVSTNA